MPEITPIRIRRGAVADLPAAVDGCPLWTTDTHDLYIGQGGVNYKIGGGSGSYSAENKDGSTISAGMACAVHTSGVGVVKASAADASKIAVGLIRADTASTFAGDVQTEGLFTLADWTAVIGSMALAAKATYFLDPMTPGTLTATPPTTSGQIVQIVGTSVSADTLDLTMETPILL